MLFSNKKSVKGYCWNLSEFDETKVKQIRLKYNFSENLSRIIAIKNIKIDKIDEFINPKIKNMLGNPFVLKDMEKGVGVIYNAIVNKEKIGIYGDYDVDGITSAALFKNYFDLINTNSNPYIPNRITEGYGLNMDALKKMKDENINLVITTDCGISSILICEQAKAIGLKIIVTDHHLGGIKIPDVEAVINPNRMDEINSEYKTLSAVGVVFLLLVCLNKKLNDEGFFKKNNIKQPNLLQFLDLVALGTVCDVMPLTGLNRAFVWQGLKIIEQRKNIGIKSIIEVAKIEDMIDVYHIGFIIGPRLNATGRVGESKLSCKILCVKKESEAKKIALELEEYNLERQRTEIRMLKEATELLENQNQKSKTKNMIFIENNNWHEGIIGILASRLKDKYDKPVFIATKLLNKYKVSCRSVVGVNIGDAIIEAMTENILIDGGGHAMAGGFNFEISKIENVKDFMEKKLEKDIQNYFDKKEKNVDLVLECKSLTLDLLKELDKLKPFGAGNNRPKIVVRNVCIVKYFYSTGKNNDNLKLIITDNNVGYNKSISAVFFRIKKEDEIYKVLTTNKIVTLCGEVRINKYKGKETIQFLIDDVMLE